jgi:hypothetical protein
MGFLSQGEPAPSQWVAEKIAPNEFFSDPAEPTARFLVMKFG